MDQKKFEHFQILKSQAKIKSQDFFFNHEKRHEEKMSIAATEEVVSVSFAKFVPNGLWRETEKNCTRTKA